MKPDAILSPSVHEAVIKRHMIEDNDDSAMQDLFDAVKLTREMATKATATTKAVLSNEMKTLPQRHRDSRAATFALLEKATLALDAATKAAQNEIDVIKTKSNGPPPFRDVVSETKARELRERLSLLDPDRRTAIIDSAIKNDDNLLIGAVLNSPAWLLGISDSEQQLFRHAWANKHFGAEIERMTRLEKAVDDAKRAGSVAISFIDGLTDADLVAKAEKMEKQANVALAAVKN